jgi:chemotaxis protein MotB
MQVLPDADGVTLSLAEAGFFAPGRAEVRVDAVVALDRLAEQLRAHDREEPLELTVAGHTDDRPLHGGRFHNNLELSAARATFVAGRLVEQHEMAAARISAAGYGEWRPVADNAAPEGRARNRRVEIRVELAASRPHPKDEEPRRP